MLIEELSTPSNTLIQSEMIDLLSKLAQETSYPNWTYKWSDVDGSSLLT